MRVLNAGMRAGRQALVRSALAGLFAVTAVTTGIIPIEQAQAQVSTSFSRIDVSGNQRIEADTIRVIAGISPNERVSPEQLNQALQNLFDSGLFENVELQPNAGRLTINVVENPTINAVAFEGNSQLDDDALAAVTQLQPITGSMCCTKSKKAG